MSSFDGVLVVVIPALPVTALDLRGQKDVYGLREIHAKLLGKINGTRADGKVDRAFGSV